MHRLVAYAHNGVQRFPIDRPELLIGSGEGCDIHLPFPGVGTQHARLRAAPDRLAIEDLGSRRGVVVNGRRVREASLQVLDEIRLGSIALLVEDVVQGPGGKDPEAAAEAPRTPTATPAGVLEHLSRISRWVLSEPASSTTLESLAIDLLEDFGGGVLFLFQGEAEKRSIKFVVASDARWLRGGEELVGQVAVRLEADTDRAAGALVGRFAGSRAWIGFQAFRALERPCLCVIALPRFREDGWSPLAALRTVGDLLILGLVHHVGQFEPILLGRQSQSDLTLAPGLVVGESKATKRMLDELRSVVVPQVHVLLRGEAGVPKELLARSLHLSGPRRDGPFVAALCRGAKAFQIEADLFGAEVVGRRGPVVREGKLLQADGGTLFLDGVEHLPLELQDRLVRFLRTGEVEPADSLRAERADVRLIAASRGPLDAYVARDQLRIDLAYTLSQLAIDVPALRERREDLPLLIQAAVNRACHETGKRVQGITVRALDALTAYDYPGNLPELENVVRRLVYLCPSGQPIDDTLLPEEVRLAKVKGLKPQLAGELDLERLVADCERSAIREALGRSGGNKSEAARLLGLSRNGLAMKIKRLELAGRKEER